MAAKIFVRTASVLPANIGGDALYEIAHAHPEYEVTCLVRNSDKGAQIGSQYAKVRLVYGDLDSSELLEEESKKADIVLQCANADHEGAVRAIAKGLAAHSEDRPGYLVHTSGTGILLFADIERKTFGEAASKIYDDWDGIDEVTSVPDTAPHRHVDKLVLSAGTEHAQTVKTAIVCPPTIYGQGRGPGNQRSQQLPELARCTLEKKHGIQVGPGLTFWPNVHVADLSVAYLKLVEAAAHGGGNATWGKDGYYFIESGEHVWGEIAKTVASAAHKQGFIPTDEVKTLPDEEFDQLTPYGLWLWGANSRARAIRARKLLGWRPKEKSIEDETPETVAVEAKRLGLMEGHANKVAG